MLEWRKLPRVNNKPTRILGLPASILRQAGIDPSKDLEAKWVVEKGVIKLIVRERSDKP